MPGPEDLTHILGCAEIVYPPTAGRYRLTTERNALRDSFANRTRDRFEPGVAINPVHSASRCVQDRRSFIAFEHFGE